MPHVPSENAASTDTVPRGDNGTVRFAIATFGRRIGIEIAAPELVEEALRRLPPGWNQTEWLHLDSEIRLCSSVPTSEGETAYSIRVDSAEPLAPFSEAGALDHFENTIQHDVAEFAVPWLFVHAGAVAWDGRAIVLPGRSFSGKSTLSAALVEAGATYLSDEYAVLDAEGRVHPYPRRLSLREGPLGPTGRIDLSNRTLPAGESLPIGLVAALKYDAEASWDVAKLTPAQAVLALCDNTVAIQRRPQDTLRIHARIAEAALAIQGTRGEIGEAVGHILHMAQWCVYHDR